MLFSTQGAYAGSINFHFGTMRFKSSVKSMSEIRWSNLTRQGWDISCGAAALSTLLTYYNKRPFSEMAITLTILKNTNPDVVKKRGGFSLYDLKRFSSAIGLDSLGYGDMTIEDLETFSVPAILPIKINNLDHFVIFKHRLGTHILIGDPAFGNLTIPEVQFNKMWKSKIAFYVVTPENKKILTQNNKSKSKHILSQHLMEFAIPDILYIPRMLSRIPVVPITRKMVVYSP